MTREANKYVTVKRRSEEIIVGACNGNENPDLWFPEMGQGGSGALHVFQPAMAVAVGWSCCPGTVDP